MPLQSGGMETIMAEIIKTFKEEIPAMRFIGKKYPNFGPWWGEWFANGWFDLIEETMGGSDAILKIWKNPKRIQLLLGTAAILKNTPEVTLIVTGRLQNPRGAS